MRRIIPGLDVEETVIDMQALTDVVRMFYSMPALQIACDAFLSMCLCGPFTFSIPRMGLRNTPDMERIIERHWMTWQRAIFLWSKLVGLCPYYLERHGEHTVPVVPDMELGEISVLVNKQHHLEYRWRWTHGVYAMAGPANEGERNMYWVITDYAPGR